MFLPTETGTTNSSGLKAPFPLAEEESPPEIEVVEFVPLNGCKVLVSGPPEATGFPPKEVFVNIDEFKFMLISEMVKNKLFSAVNRRGTSRVGFLFRSWAFLGQSLLLRRQPTPINSLIINILNLVGS